MSLKLVREDKDGAYIAAAPELLQSFKLIESDPNFEVYDTRDGCNRLVIAKSSRLPDDNNLNQGRYGINFHRKKPSYDEAFKYRNGLKHITNTSPLLNDMAFIASGRDEYEKKASVWDKFYSYIWGRGPLTLWVTPHSGCITRQADSLIPWPKLEHDAYVSGVAAACALADNKKPSRRTMVSLHSHNWLGAVLDVGGFGVIDKAKLLETERRITLKYHDKIQFLAGECMKRFAATAMNWIEHIIKTRSTLDPDELTQKSTLHRGIIILITKSLALYGKEIAEFTPAEFEKAVSGLNGAALQVMSYNYLYPGEHIGKLIKLPDKIRQGQLDNAVQIECSKACLDKAPDLISDIILEIKRELFDA